MEPINHREIITEMRLSYILEGGSVRSTDIILQGMVDGSASKPALRQDTGYMVEKTYKIIANNRE